MEPYSIQLKRAREAKGLTTSQVAAKTRLLVQVVEDLEAERFKSVPAPIYGRGFVRLYAECVGLDSAPLVSDFMAAYSGKRPVGALSAFETKPVAAAPASGAEVAPVPSKTPAGAPVVTPEPVAASVAPVSPAPVVTNVINPSAEIPDRPAPFGVQLPKPTPLAAQPAKPEQPVEQPSVVQGLDLFDQASRVVRAQAVAQELGVKHASSSPFVTSATYGEDKPKKEEAEKPKGKDTFNTATTRFRSNLSNVSHGVLGHAKRIPQNVWRMAILASGVVVVLVLLCWACRALYHLTEEDNGKKALESMELAATRQAPVLNTQAPASGGDTLAATARAGNAKKAKTPVHSSSNRKVPQLYVD